MVTFRVLCLFLIVVAVPSSWALKCYQCNNNQILDNLPQCSADSKPTECPAQMAKYCTVYKKLENGKVNQQTYKCSATGSDDGKESCQEPAKNIKTCNTYCKTDGCNSPDGVSKSTTKSKDSKGESNVIVGNVVFVMIMLILTAITRM